MFLQVRVEISTQSYSNFGLKTVPCAGTADMGGNLLATEAADRAPEQGDLRGRGRARAAEARRYPGLDLTAWRA